MTRMKTVLNPAAFATRGYTTTLLLLLSILLAPATTFAGAEETEYLTPPTIASFSGSPLTLEVLVPDPDGRVTAIEMETGAGRHEWRFERGDVGRDLSVVVQPFTRPGVHELAVAVTYEPGSADVGPVRRRWEYEIGFVDFVFGRDNLRFGNNSSLESTIGTFGEILEEWLEIRFGGVSDAELVLLVDYMYSLFGTNTGRCYAFSGTAVRAWRWPQTLPRYIDTTYDLRATSGRTQTEMSHLQLDMVFERFVARRSDAGSAFALGPMESETAAAELAAIVADIRAGRPIVVGFTGPALHHSMVVFGYIAPADGSRVDLLVANNWKSGEDVNAHSRDAEMVSVSPGDAGGPVGIAWRHWEGPREEQIDRLFTVDVRVDEYAHDRAHLERLIVDLAGRFVSGGREIIVVEDAAGAWLVNGESRAGRLRGRTRNQIAGVEWERVSRAYRFLMPPGAADTLEIADDAGARVLRLVPAHAAQARGAVEVGSDSGDGLSAPLAGRAVITVTQPPADGSTVTRTIALSAEDVPSALVEASE